jgi:hypothetical protein
MGQFQEGQKRPRGSGRKPGTPNKKTVQLKEFFDKAKFNIPERILEILPQLPISKQADLLVGLMAYVYPKLKNVELETVIPPEQKCIRIEFVKAGLEVDPMGKQND